jgi:thiamine pyrophosphokinase
MSKCVVFSGGKVTGGETLPPTSDTLVLSADGGYLNALKFGLTPNVCIGDFDTLKTLKTTIDPTCTVLTHPTDKDDTDTMLCVKYALSKGCDSIYVYGALGGRFDHTMANVQTLEYITNSGAVGYLVDSQNVVTMQGVSSRVYPKLDGFNYYSILAVSGSAVVTSTGLKYPLSNTTLTRDFPLGVSNVILEAQASLTIHQGLVLVTYSKD